jgi:response regulator RpfG family c-di-GMP phosphodiesterase
LEQRSDIAVVLSDMYMPGMTGIELLAEVERRFPEVIREMLTGHADLSLAVRAMHEGRVFRFLSKPCSPDELAAALDAGIAQHALLCAERDLLENTLNGTIAVLTDILSVVAPESFGRAVRLRDAMGLLARHLKLEQPYTYELAAMLAPIGLVAVPPSVVAAVRSGRALSSAERTMLSRVPELGSKLLQRIPRMETVAEIVRYQQKQWNGAGPPTDGVAGEKIPLGARMLKLLSDRQQGLKAERGQTFSALRSRGGTYDPRLLDAAEQCFAGGAAPESGLRDSSFVGVEALQVGDVLAQDVCGLDGHLLLAGGNVVTETVLERLRNFAELGALAEPIAIQRTSKGAP